MAGLKTIIIGYAVFSLFSCSYQKEKTAQTQAEFNPHFIEYPINSSIRALEVINEKKVWFAGSKGIFGFTKDGGDHWEIDSIQIDGKPLEFRSIAVTNRAVFLLNVASPAYLLKSEDDGQNWDIVYHEDHPDVFYNSLKFWDTENGIAVGDPIDGCLSVIITNNGGASWEKLDCSSLPPTVEGEAGFAASNTNIALKGDHVWLASGGKKARIFHSSDKGKSWEVVDTPMQQGGKMTGIFSVEFYDENLGIIFGGDWEDQSNNKGNKAITSDGGITWQLINDGQDPGYRSCVQFIQKTKGQGILAVGIPGISYSPNGGNSWQHFNKDYYYTLRIAKSEKVAWLAGKNKIAKMNW